MTDMTRGEAEHESRETKYLDDKIFDLRNLMRKLRKDIQEGSHSYDISSGIDAVYDILDDIEVRYSTETRDGIENDIEIKDIVEEMGE